MCERTQYVSRVFGAELKVLIPVLFFTPWFLFPADNFFFYLQKVIFAAMEISIFVDNSHAWLY